MSAEDRPVLVLDGATFDDYEDLQKAFSSFLSDYVWGGNLDAFNDILRGGFGTPDAPWVLRWVESSRSKAVLGHAATARYLSGLLDRCHPSNVPRIEQELADARAGRGPTLFDRIVYPDR